MSDLFDKAVPFAEELAEDRDRWRMTAEECRVEVMCSRYESLAAVAEELAEALRRCAFTIHGPTHNCRIWECRILPKDSRALSCAELLAALAKFDALEGPRFSAAVECDSPNDWPDPGGGTDV